MDRTIFRKGLHSLYLPFYDALRLRLKEDFQPISGLRSFEEQAELYAQGRTKPGPKVTKAKPGMSFHNYGLASDWGYFPGGKYTPIDATDPVWEEYTTACDEVGVRRISWEIPHNEAKLNYPVSWLYSAYQSGGQAAVESLLAKGINYVGTNS